MPVAYEFGVKTGAFPIVADGQRRSAHQPAGFGRARNGLGGVAQGKQSDAVFCRRQCQPAAGNEVENLRSRPGFDHHRAKAGAIQCFRAGTQTRRRIGGFHHQKARRVDAKSGKAAGKNAAPFDGCKILLHPEQPFVATGNTRGQSQGEAGGCWCIACRVWKNFMQSAARQSAIQARICRGMTQRADLRLRHRVTSSEAPAQSRRQFMPVSHESGTFLFAFCSIVAPSPARVKSSHSPVVSQFEISA